MKGGKGSYYSNSVCKRELECREDKMKIFWVMRAVDGGVKKEKKPDINFPGQDKLDPQKVLSQQKRHRRPQQLTPVP